MQPQLGGGRSDRFHKGKLAVTAAAAPAVSRWRGEERRGERVSPLREPPLDGVHVHQLSVVVDEEEGEWYSPCEIVLLFYFCSAVQSVTDGRR